MGAHLNYTANVEGLATSSSTSITSASILESVSFAKMLKGDKNPKSINFSYHGCIGVK